MGKRFLAPLQHATRSSAPSSPVQGEEYFDTTLNQLRVWDGTQWVNEGGGGSGAATFNQYTMFFEKAGPSSYATGGFVIDLRSTYSTINFFKLVPKKGARGSMPLSRIRYRLNVPSAGQVTVMFYRYTYVRVSAVGNVSGQPSGVTVRATSGGTSSSENAHTHTHTHGHTGTSSTPTAGGAGTALNALGPNMSSHTHAVTISDTLFTSGIGTSHNHLDNTIYQHSHSLTEVATALTLTEYTNTNTDLATTTFYGYATGVRAA